MRRLCSRPAPPTGSHVTRVFYCPSVLKLRHSRVFGSVNMALTVANKCRSSLTFLTRTLSAPEFFTQCCYHKKVKHVLAASCARISCGMFRNAVLVENRLKNNTVVIRRR